MPPEETPDQTRLERLTARHWPNDAACDEQEEALRTAFLAWGAELERQAREMDAVFLVARVQVRLAEADAAARAPKAPHAGERLPDSDSLTPTTSAQPAHALPRAAPSRWQRWRSGSWLPVGQLLAVGLPPSRRERWRSGSRIAATVVGGFGVVAAVVLGVATIYRMPPPEHTVRADVQAVASQPETSSSVESLADDGDGQAPMVSAVSPPLAVVAPWDDALDADLMRAAWALKQMGREPAQVDDHLARMGDQLAALDEELRLDSL